MAQSIPDACNSALQKVGAARILSLSDNSREARACSVAFDSNRRAELRKRKWNFAKKRVILAPDATAPAFEYDYAFTLPSDCLRVIFPKDASLDWHVENGKILTNWATSPVDVGTIADADGAALALTYIADIEDTAVWDTTFYDLFCIALAIDICEELTNSNVKKKNLFDEYKDAEKDALAANAFEVLPEESPDDSWILARF